MDINQIKKLIKKVGGVLVMDGDQPSFVMLSYEHYNNLNNESENQDVEEAVSVPVHNDSSRYAQEFGHNLHVGLASNMIENFGDQTQDMPPIYDEDKIKRLNEEIALLKSEIKQREIDEFLGDIDPVK